MKSAKKSKVKDDELDEDTPSKETLQRRRDRKLKDDITNMMYRLEMESIKPSFDVLLQTGLHRGHYGRNLYKKRRPKTTKGLRGDIDEEAAGVGGHSRSQRAGKDDAAESRYPSDRHARPSAVLGDSDKRKTYDREQDGGAWRTSDFRDLSPESLGKPLKTAGGEHSLVAGRIRSAMKDDASTGGGGLSAMVMRASRLSTDDLDDATPRWSTHATLRRSGDYRHYPGAAVISVEELPRPQRRAYLLQETEKTHGSEDSDRAWIGSLKQRHWSASSAHQSDGPYAGVRPISLHGDDLMAYVNEAESSPRDFTLDAILAHREEPKHQQPARLQSVGASTANVYTADDEIGQLYRLLDNPFSGHEYDRTVPKQHITFSENYSSLPYTPKTIITSPSLRYT